LDEIDKTLDEISERLKQWENERKAERKRWKNENLSSMACAALKLLAGSTKNLISRNL